MFSVYHGGLYELSVRSRVQTGTVLWEKEPCLGGTIYVIDFVSLDMAYVRSLVAATMLYVC